MNLIRNILLFKAVVFILLHGLIPHRHHVEMAYEEHIITHERADDIIDFLGLGFQQDSNKDLANYILTGQNFPKKIEFSGFNFLASVCFTKGESIFVSKSLYFKTQPQKLFNDFLILSNGLRAPPGSDFYS